jgi:hypothetical protein
MISRESKTRVKKFFTECLKKQLWQATVIGLLSQSRLRANGRLMMAAMLAGELFA